MWPNPQFASDLVKLTEEILNGKLHFLFSLAKNFSVKNVKEYDWLSLSLVKFLLKRRIWEFLVVNFESLSLCEKCSKYGDFSFPYFPLLGLNTGKYGPEKSPYLATFHAVLPYHLTSYLESAKKQLSIPMESTMSLRFINVANIFFWCRYIDSIRIILYIQNFFHILHLLH